MEAESTVSIGEAARLLGVPVHTLRRWCDRGLVPYTLWPSGYRRFTSSQIDEIKRMMATRREQDDRHQ